MHCSSPAEERLALTLIWLATGWHGLLVGKGQIRLFLTNLPAAQGGNHLSSDAMTVRNSFCSYFVSENGKLSWQQLASH